MEKHILRAGVIFSYGFNSPSNIIDIYDEATGTWSRIFCLSPGIAMLWLVQGITLLSQEEKTNQCFNSLVEIFYDPQTRITSQSNEDAFFNIYPNPADQMVTISVKNGTSSKK